jgi:hypothetical protein
MRFVTITAAVVAACLLSACAGGGGDGDGDSGNGGPACTPPPGGATISYTDNIQPIYDRSCALSGCHVPGALGGDLDLTPGRSYRQTINVPSFQQRQKRRIVPGDPDASYLVQKIEGTPGITGLPMPQTCPTPPPGGQCLTPDDRAAIRQWITECAPGPMRAG